MSLDLARTGEALLATSSELHRIWRSARAQIRPNVFPGLLDEAVGAFLERAGRWLEAGAGDPAEPYRRIAGVVRVDALDRRWSASEIDTEWRLAGEVLKATCDALDAGKDARDLLARAIDVAREGADDLARGRGPEGIMVLGQLSGFRPQRRRRED